ncbi:enoyl-CoA hydratase [Chloroflexota bacterium]
MAFKTILYDKVDGNIAKITMNRPEVRNAESRLMSKELLEAFQMADEDPAIKVIILAGAGPSFSGGHDLGSKEAIAEEKSSSIRQHGNVDGFVFEKRRWVDAWLYVRDIGKPTIAQVQGHAIMGGFMLAAMCDLIIASEDAKFSDRGIRTGGVGVEVFFHPWQLGIRKCKEFLFTGDYMDAQEAWRIGFVNRVVPGESLDEETLNFARRIALASAASLRFAKMTINDAEDVMGFRSSVNSHFKTHHLAKLYTAMETDTPSLGLAKEKGVKGLRKERDLKYGE